MFRRVHGARAWVLGVGGFLGVLGAIATYVGIVTQALPHAWQPYAILIIMAGFAAALWATGTSEVAVDGVIYRENIVHRGRIAELETQLQTLTTDNATLRSSITLIVASDVKVAVMNLEARIVLRNKVLALVAELGDIWNRVKVEYIYYETPPKHWNVWVGEAFRTRALNAYYAPRWEQYLKIWRAEFAERVKEVINELRLAGAASDKLIAFPEADPNYHSQLPVDDFIPTLVPTTLIPELVSAADALTRSQPT